MLLILSISTCSICTAVMNLFQNLIGILGNFNISNSNSNYTTMPEFRCNIFREVIIRQQILTPYYFTFPLVAIIFQLIMTEGTAFVNREVTFSEKSIFSATPAKITMTTKVYRLFHQVNQVKNKSRSKYCISSNISAGGVMLKKSF